MIFAKNLILALSEAGVECRSVFLQSRTSPIVLVREVKRLRRELAQFHPNVIHAHYGTVTAAVCALSSRVPLVITYRGSDLNPGLGLCSLRSAVGRLLSQFAALRASRMMCVSTQLKSRLWWRQRFVAVVPSGVDLQRFRPMAKAAARIRMGWKSDEKVVIFNAGFDAIRKRLDLAEAAIQMAHRWCGDIRLEILDGSATQERIPFYLNAADCLLMTSDWEGSPNIVKEAIACNLPVVSVDVGDVKERLAHVRPSRIVGRDPLEIGRALAGFLQKPERSNGFEAIQDLSSEKVAERVVALYREALGMP
ncbi:MAG: glycosyltransferase [Nitrospira defluvii]|nr:glycosyltransferase [Nitrospira defluvii]